jgi:predicted O-methyltransferase YrrM
MTMKLEELKEWYDKRLRERYPTFKEGAMSLPGIAYVLEVLGEVRPKWVLELGSGFSTLVLRTWQKQLADSGSEYVPELVTADHEPTFLAFTRKCLAELGLGRNELHVLDKAFRERTGGMGLYHAIIIDQGPTLDTRVADLSWCLPALAPGGMLLFDDWRPKFAGKVKRALEPRGFVVREASAVRRFPTDKAIGVATIAAQPPLLAKAAPPEAPKPAPAPNPAKKVTAKKAAPKKKAAAKKAPPRRRKKR